MSNTETAMRRMLETKLCTRKLETTLRYFLGEYEGGKMYSKSAKDPSSGLPIKSSADYVFLYTPETRSEYPMMITVSALIAEAIGIAKHLSMPPEDFKPIGDLIDSL